MPAAAEDEDRFVLGDDGALHHLASGFACPARIGVFERDAAGAREGSPYCAYSAVPGLYGTVILKPLTGDYDPKALLAAEGRHSESLGGEMLSETEQLVGPDAAPVPVTLRTYQTGRLDTLSYRTQLAVAPFGAFVVEVVIEYAYPRDKEEQTSFVTAVYSEAIQDIGGR